MFQIVLKEYIVYTTEIWRLWEVCVGSWKWEMGVRMGCVCY